MLDDFDSDVTLPSVVASLVGKYRDPDLVLTIVFHPDTSRIGETVLVPRFTGTAPWILGRRHPLFKAACVASAQEQVTRPLDDQHISRVALKIEYHGSRIVLSRARDTSRARAGDREIVDTVELDADQMRIGVPIMLSHSVVLLLRFAPGKVGDAQQVRVDEPLRGGSLRMQRLREQVARAAAGDMDVLVRGETGTGKELVASAIHRNSARAQAPIISVNMAAIPTELAAAALFGSVRGAFTGADKAAPGYFEQAAGGCLFLDEIGEAAHSVQPQLLRALQQREIQSVGGPIREVDVRIIAATDAALEGEGSDFKAALRYRLAACEIALPALREHPEDIGELMQFFLAAHAAQARQPELLPHAQSPALEVAAWASLFFRLLSHPWPGNIRELDNLAQQLVLACESSNHLLDVLARTLKRPPGSTVNRAQGHLRSMQDVAEGSFNQAMESNGYEVIQVARELGVSRASVYRRIDAGDRYRLVSQIPVEELQLTLAAHSGDSTAAAAALRVSLGSLRTRLRKLQLDWR